MRKLLVSLLLLSAPSFAMERLSGFCEQGAKVVVAPNVPGGPPIQRSFQQSYPVCTVTVFVTGSGGQLATIYSTNEPSPTPLSNPFQATTLGYWDFYSMNGHYDVQISGGGLPTPFTFGDNSLFDIIDFNPCPGCILSATGFISTGGQYNDFSTATGGALFRAQNVIQTANGLAGGYIKLSPITYNPNDGPPQFDIFGNPIRNPVYLPGDTLGSHDAVLFVGEATSLIPNPDLVMGLFTNVYVFSRVGFATDFASEASFQSLNGGMQALSFAAVNYVNAGQHAGTPPPLTNLDQFHPGAIFYDTVAGCMKVYSGTAWSCLGGGGGGSGNPAGSDTQVQFNNSSVFGASPNFSWSNTAQLLNVNAVDSSHAGINVHTGFIQADTGFVVGVGTTYNSVNAVLGGVAARSFTGTNYVQTGTGSTAPGSGSNPLTAGDSLHPGTMYWDTVNSCESVYNGSGFTCLAASGGSTSPGPPTNSVQYNIAGTFTGNGKFTWDPGQFLNIIAASTSSAGLNVQVGFIQSAVGFVAAAGTATTYNAIQAISGGMAANSFTAQSYIQMGNNPFIPGLTGGDSFHAGAMYWNNTSNSVQVYNGVTWTTLGGGGVSTPASPTNSVQYNNAGTFGGSSNFSWSNTLQLLNVVATSSAAPGINVQAGFIQSDIGFVASPFTATTFNAIQAVGGGLTGRSVTAAVYTQTGTNFGIPTATSGDSFHPGAMYYDQVVHQELVYNGTGWAALGGGSTPGGPANAVQYNSSGVFSGTSNFTWNGTNLAVSGNVTITPTTATFLGLSNFAGITNDTVSATLRGSTFIAGGVNPGQLVIQNSANLLFQTTATISVPVGTVMNGSFTCLGSTHLNGITTFQGLVTGVTCTP